MLEFLQIFFLLVFVHTLADYPLQGDFLAKAKNHVTPIPGIPWYQAMSAHSMIHAGFVYVITGSIILGFLEFIVHFLTDFSKNAGVFDFDTDQFIHIFFKIIWAYVALNTIT